MPLSRSQRARFHRINGQPLTDSPPSIRQVRDASAPLWSVMIPTYHCAQFLRQALESVLAQAPGREVMQIEVVDDASTRDDPAAVVRAIGGNRVEFFRQPANVGVTANFNTCLRRSRGRLVHILHGDDFVDPGFYARLTDVALAHPRVNAFFARCRVVDEQGILESVAPRCRFLEQPSREVSALLQTNTLYTPGVVVRRACYEKHGGFLPSLVHCADWEMWVRAISRGGGLMLSEVLASYRFFPQNDTNRLVRTGENIRDRMRLAEVFARQYPQFDYGLAERTLARQALRQMQRCQQLGDTAGAATNRRLYRLLAPPARRRLLAAWDREIGITAWSRRDVRR